MVKIFAFSLLSILASHAHATINPTDLVGSWRCITDYQSDHITAQGSTLNVVKADGEVVQFSEYSSFEHDKLTYFAFATLTQKWHVKGDTLHMQNAKILSYAIYDGNGEPADKTTKDKFTEYLNNSYASPHRQTIKFINKDRFIVPDMMGNDGSTTRTNQCNRLITVSNNQ